MPKPTEPVAVVAGAPGLASWANSVVDAVVAIIDDIYGAVNLEIPWANVTGKPSTFAPTLGNVTAQTSYGGSSSNGSSTSGAKADHLHGTVPLPTPAQLNVPSTYTTPATATTRRIYVGSATPTGASDGDVWIKLP
jgi:hypothetical protein